MEPDDDFVKGRPTFRHWELDENATRYDRLASGPSDAQLVKYWFSWTGISFAVGFFSFLVFLSILLSPRARKSSFNLYLLYLMVPDFTFSLLCALTCFLNAINKEYWSSWMCNFQTWFCVFGIGANAWLNTVVAYQLHTMLSMSHDCRRYTAPTRTRVTVHALLVYLYCGFLGTWGLVERERYPFHSGSVGGLACLPIETDVISTVFFWAVFFPLFAGIPIMYVFYVLYDVLKRHLLPSKGKRRLIALYFFRLIAVFLIMWLPTCVLLWMAASYLPTSVQFAGGTWSHLQGAVSAGVSLLKPDIFRAFRNFMCCRQDNHDDNHHRARHRQRKNRRRSSTHWIRGFSRSHLSLPGSSLGFKIHSHGEDPEAGTANSGSFDKRPFSGVSSDGSPSLPFSAVTEEATNVKERHDDRTPSLSGERQSSTVVPSSDDSSKDSPVSSPVTLEVAYPAMDTEGDHSCSSTEDEILCGQDDMRDLSLIHI